MGSENKSMTDITGRFIRLLAVAGLFIALITGCHEMGAAPGDESSKDGSEVKARSFGPTPKSAPSPSTHPPATSGDNIAAKDMLPKHSLPGECFPEGRTIISGTFSGDATGFNRGADGDTDYATSAIALSSDDKTLNVFDVGRILNYSLSGVTATRTSSVSLPDFPPDAAIALPSGGFASFDFYHSKLRTYGSNGKLKVDDSIQIAGPTFASGGRLQRQPALFNAPSGTWLSNFNGLTHVLLPDGTRAHDLREIGAMVYLDRSIRISPEIVGGGKKIKRLTISIGPQGKDETKKVDVKFEDEILEWFPPEVSPKGDIFLLTSHEWRENGFEYSSLRTRLTVLSPELALKERLLLPPHPGSLPRSRPIAVAGDGSFYHLAVSDITAVINRYQPDKSGRFVCGSAPRRTLEPQIDWDQVPASKIRNGEELGCRAQRAEGWLRLYCKGAKAFPGDIRGLSIASDDNLDLINSSLHNQRISRRADGHESSKSTKESGTSSEILVRFTKGTRLQGNGAWERAYRNLELVWSEHEEDPEYVGRFVEGMPPKAAQSCAGMSRAFEDIQRNAQLSLAERGSLPKNLHTCIAGGPGAWIASIEGIKRVNNCGEAACLNADFVVSAIDSSGERSMMGATELDFTPDNFSLLQGVSDFDGDEQQDFFVIAEVKSGPGAPGLSQIWTMDGHAKLLEGAPEWFFHEAKRVDSDEFFDLLTYGPYREQLRANCGVKDCPSEIKGPELLAHNDRSSFSFNGAASKAHLKKSCLGVAGSPLEKLAREVVCRRLQGETSEVVLKYTIARRSELCIEPSSCVALDTIEAWAKGGLAQALR